MAATHFIQKFTPTNIEYQEYMISLSVEVVRAIAALRHKMIKVCVIAVNCDHITPEEQAFGFFTKKNLKTLSANQE